MLEARFFRGRIRMTRNHRVVPLFDGFWRMLHSVFLYPRRNCFVMFKLVGDLFKYVAVDFKECQQMFVEPDGFIVVTVKQAFPVQPGLIDQTRQMNITAESFVRTAWMQSSHEPDGCYVAGNGRATGSDRKSTRLNSSHSQISYAVFCLKKKKNETAVGSAHTAAKSSKRRA